MVRDVVVTVDIMKWFVVVASFTRVNRLRKIIAETIVGVALVDFWNDVFVACKQSVLALAVGHQIMQMSRTMIQDCFGESVSP
jgi:hypothetical protein